MGAMNELIDAAAVLGLRDRLNTAAAAVRWTELTASADELDALSLRERSDLVSAALIADLGRSSGSSSAASTRTPGAAADYSSAAGIFRALIADPSFRGWTVWPVSETVTTLALAEAHSGVDAFPDGMALLAELTPRLTAEFAIRRFLEADLDRALDIVQAWTGSPDEHVRRLASEGTRSYLPWAIRVRALLRSPRSTIPILDALVHDDSEYVRRSVANHLNDLSREHADVVVEVAGRWLADPGTDATTAANTRSLVRHALRTLVKRADPGALALLGFEPVRVEVSDLVFAESTVVLPGELEFSFTVANRGDAPARLAIDFAVAYVKSNGGLAEKVFKLSTVELAAGERTTVRKRHGFRQMTTRVHYAGTHGIEVQINGERHARAEFEVVLEGGSVLATGAV
ncbi:DNA alkylation repair protein [Plantibacter sp. YIM 135347]|uniref:DNA alkylation repair protein n=1 Tax=Plantibacter sp. YIM 135347 TaxID=3423919 RepID=UPI003D32A915